MTQWEPPLSPSVWRTSVNTRDMVCQKTGLPPAPWPHTILDHRMYPHKQYRLWNGVALSYDAHKEFHDKYGYRGFTWQNLEDFLGRELAPEQRDILIEITKTI